MASTDSRSERRVGPPGLVYLAGPVDAIGREAAQDWRDEVQTDLARLNLSSYSPPHALAVRGIDDPDSEDLARACIEINTVALVQSIAVLANACGPSFGTSIECMQALQEEKPVFVFGGPDGSIYRHKFACWTVLWDDAIHHLGEWQCLRGE